MKRKRKLYIGGIILLLGLSLALTSCSDKPQVIVPPSPPDVPDRDMEIDEDHFLLATLSLNASTTGMVFRIVDEPSPDEGTLALKPTGDFQFIPSPDFSGNTSFTYRVRSGDLFSNIGTVYITVHPVNDPPVVPDEIFYTRENDALENGVWAEDPDGRLTFEVIDGIPPGEGEMLFHLNGDFRYEPPLNFTGNTSFTYRASDGIVNSNIGTVVLVVTPAE